MRETFQEYIQRKKGVEPSSLSEADLLSEIPFYEQESGQTISHEEWNTMKSHIYGTENRIEQVDKLSDYGYPTGETETREVEAIEPPQPIDTEPYTGPELEDYTDPATIDYETSPYTETTQPGTDNAGRLNKISSGIQQGAHALQTVMQGKRDLLKGGIAIGNSLVQERHNERETTTPRSENRDPYGSRQFNNMYEEGGKVESYLEKIDLKSDKVDLIKFILNNR